MPRAGQQALTWRSAITYRYLWSMEKAMSRSTGLPSLNTVTTSYWIPPWGGPSARICREKTQLRGAPQHPNPGVILGDGGARAGGGGGQGRKGINSKISAPIWRQSRGSVWQQGLEQRFCLHWSRCDFANPGEIMREFCDSKVSTETASEL